MKFKYIYKGERSVSTTPESKGGVQSPSFDLLVLYILILSWIKPNQGQKKSVVGLDIVERQV